ncbi:MAG: hypothetical protein ACRELB_23000 [Polyangiaceae bacterium]
MRRSPSLALVLAVSLLALARPAAAQQDEGAPRTETLRPPTVLVRPEPGKPEVPLRVAAVNAQVVLIGGIAETTLDITFRNDLDRVLEGELVLPLPRGATI